jgi:hypothetical protein
VLGGRIIGRAPRLKNLPAAAPAFWAEFEVCSRYTEWLSADLSVVRSCKY